MAFMFELDEDELNPVNIRPPRTITVKIYNDRIFAEDDDDQFIIINKNNGKLKSFLHGDKDFVRSVSKLKNNKKAWMTIGHMLGFWNETDTNYS